MKHLVIVTAVFAYVQCAVSDLVLHPDAIAVQLAYPTNHVRHLIKRQTDTSSLLRALDCSATATDYQCSSGYYQQFVDIALGCGNKSIAMAIAELCQRIENGDFCVPATFRFLRDHTETFNQGGATCVTALTTGTCPSSCRSALQLVSSELGCCLNTNITKSFVTVNAALWNICSVPQPADDCVDGLTLNPPQNAQTCSLQELIGRVADYTCMPSVGQPLVDALLQNSNCDAMARQYVDICSTNANGQNCSSVLQSSLVLNVNGIGPAASDSSFTTLLQNCSSSSLVSSSEFQCDSSCESAVNNIANAYGCCVSVFNVSLDGVQPVVPQLSHGLWNSCGVETPGVCNVSTLRFSRSSVTIMKSLATSQWMVAILVAVCIMALS